jgi:SHS2 domain-containing protein
MGKYEMLPHISDVRVKVSAETLKELFEAALTGMNSIIKNDFDKSKTEAGLKEILNINSMNISTLLVDFLSEILTLSHTHKALFVIFSFLQFNDNHLNAKLTGYKVDGFDEDIKAVTYTETEIIMNKENQYEAVIVMDI